MFLQLRGVEPAGGDTRNAVDQPTRARLSNALGIRDSAPDDHPTLTEDDRRALIRPTISPDSRDGAYEALADFIAPARLNEADRHVADRILAALPATQRRAAAGYLAGLTDDGLADYARTKNAGSLKTTLAMARMCPRA